MAHINQNYFTPSNKKQIFEIFSDVNYKLKQLGSIHTGGMTLFFNDKSKEPKWHISIGSDNEAIHLFILSFLIKRINGYEKMSKFVNILMMHYQY